MYRSDLLAAATSAATPFARRGRLLRALTDQPASAELAPPAEAAAFSYDLGDQQDLLRIDSLVDLAWQLRFDDPAQAHQQSLLAGQLLANLPTSIPLPWRETARLRTLVSLANTARVRGEPQSSARYLDEACQVLPFAFPDPVDRARLLAGRGALANNLGQWQQSIHYFRRAAAWYRCAGETDDHAGAVLAVAAAYLASGRFHLAANRLHQLKPWAHATANSTYRLIYDQVLTAFLLETGRTQDALDYLTAAAPRWSQGPAALRVRLHWMFGRILAASGQQAAACGSFVAARATQHASVSAQEVAHLALDYALSAHALGRFGEVVTLAAEIVTIFRDKGLGSTDINPALAVLEQAVVAQSVSLAILQNLSDKFSARA